jgi:hypothetical protein
MLPAILSITPFVSNVDGGAFLVDMYSICGGIFDAQKSHSWPVVAVWTALINGYARLDLALKPLCCLCTC